MNMNMKGMKHHNHAGHAGKHTGRKGASKKPSMDMMSLRANTPEQHAFVMCGTKALFLAHLTMFHMEEHCYMLVLRAHLPEDAMKKYVADRRRHPKSCYFLGNSTLDGMEVPDFQSGRRKAFIGDVFRDLPMKVHYRSWPWAKQKPLLKSILVSVDRIVYYRHFDFNLEYPRNLTYVMFGEGDEAFLDHYQTKEPDFDQVVALKRAPRWLPTNLLESGIDVNFPDLATLPTPCKNPIARGVHHVQYGQAALRPIEVDRNYWFSTKVVNGTDPCAYPPHKGP